MVTKEYIKVEKRTVALIVLLGIIFGFMLSSSSGCAAMLLVFTITGILVYRYSETSYKKFLLILFITGISSRVLFLFLTHIALVASGNFYINFLEYGYGYITSLFGDSGYYTFRSWWLSQLAQGIELPKEVFKEAFVPYGTSNFLRVLAMFHSLFGFSPISSTLINCYLGSLTALLTFDMTKIMFNPRVAKLSSALVMFFPSLFIWSLTNLKETFVIFILILTLYSFIKFYSTRKKLYIFLLFISMALLPGLREGTLNIMLIIFSLTTFIIWKNTNFKKMILALSLCLLVLLNLGVVKHYLHKTMLHIANYHKGVITSGGYVYQLLDAKFYIGENVQNVTYMDFIKMIPKGIIHFCLEPFPWHIESWSMLLIYPQMLLWYFMTFLSFIGVFLALKYCPRISMVLIVYLILTTLSLSITGGNIGTDFRHRDILTPIILIFGSLGLLKAIGKLNLKELPENTVR